MRKNKTFALLAIIAAAVSAFVVAPTSAFALPTEYTTYISVLTPAGSTGKKVIDILDGSTADRAPAQLWALNNNPQQYWTLKKVGVVGTVAHPYDLFTLRRANTQMCLDKSQDRGDVNGASVYQYHCVDNAANQAWYYEPVPGSNWGYLHSLVDQRCLDVTDLNFTNGARLQVWDCLGNWNQRWNIQP